MTQCLISLTASQNVKALFSARLVTFIYFSVGPETLNGFRTSGLHIAFVSSPVPPLYSFAVPRIRAYSVVASRRSRRITHETATRGRARVDAHVQARASGAQADRKQPRTTSRQGTRRASKDTRPTSAPKASSAFTGSRAGIPALIDFSPPRHFSASMPLFCASTKGVPKGPTLSPSFFFFIF